MLPQTQGVKEIHVHIRCAGPLPVHPLSLLLGAIHSFLSFVFGFSSEKFRLSLFR